MVVIRVEILIHASPEVCFDLARDIDVHVATTKKTGERAIAGVTSGMVFLGDTVTFEAKHLGFRHRLTSKIVAYERPTLFIDEMVSGPFSRLRHEHRFEQKQGGTLMVDTLDFQSSFGPVGLVVDKVFMRQYLTRFLARRNQGLKAMAEQLRITEPNL